MVGLRRFFFLALLLATLFAAPMAMADERSDALSAQVREDAKSIDSLRADLVKVAKSVRSAQDSQARIDKMLGELTTKYAHLSGEVRKEQANLASMLMALQRLKRVPPETVIIKPGSPLEIAQTTMILRSTIPAIEEKAKSLGDLMRDYEETRRTLEEQKAAALETRQELEAQQKKMTTLLDERERRYTRTRIMLSEHTKKLNALAKKARDLAELVSAMEEPPANAATSPALAALLSPEKLPQQGKPQLPVSGVVAVRFGDPDAFGAPSQGLTIRAAAKSLAITPMGGRVKYAGPFKNFGNLVIIEHRSGYHSLIGGLEKIAVNVGQVIVSGEPVGILGKSVSGGPANLYFEFRRNGKPVDPSNLFSDLG